VAITCASALQHLKTRKGLWPYPSPIHEITRGVSHCGLAIYIKKYLKAKEELWELKYFIMQKSNLQKILSKKPKSFKITYYNSVTNLKFQHKPKYHVSKILILKKK
jgi:hypothetical protein